MSTQEVTGLKKIWCRCVNGPVDYKYVARLNICGTPIEVYECSRCFTVKRVELTIQQADIRFAHGPGPDRQSRQIECREVASAPLLFQV